MYEATASAAADGAGAAETTAQYHPVILRAARCDTLVASTVLVLLLAGWLVRLSDANQFRWVGDFLISSTSRHA